MLALPPAWLQPTCVIAPMQVERCTTHCKHDWKKCPFSHPTENARRRDPRLHNYIPESCPNYKELGACSWGALLPCSRASHVRMMNLCRAVVRSQQYAQRLTR